MLLLALDTSTPAVTVALHDGERVLAEATTVDPRRHTELLMPLVTSVLDDAGAGRRDLTELAVGVGPGPFTGLRVGLAAARTMGAVLDLPVRGVCSLDVLAYGVRAANPPGEPFAVATDARRREVYWATYDAGGVRVSGPDVGPAAALAEHRLPAAGAGARLYPDAFARALDPEYPSAAHLAAAVVAEAVEILPPDPLYLRRPDATPPSARKSVLAR
ncbi:tRNA (adenosine(37)-N6)-threonylcarbamoyltransferase complex dimerization subunit type 1 TsaB [Jiangella sp. DSM 45060]|uniref:tRNA (adenosine(37)-N6)-threonylcarbamoyltransferase complex dimerization subunit type 1 TsaB n=1 Tax=Jiangella sp. DSM 45060 TaxID=1798224 RepID=UPI000879E894|nr:tRNA (adenosine(37)-N6)-threonylcarbamoyltransferase complex dimerization subunit type 1 TsaB [Jiangella sp. DSM 45060]SDS04472.1 tRNA threonylcarbamoyl adenosine modification protein YeaZ [Jiangella sp. DSM 45060]